MDDNPASSVPFRQALAYWLKLGFINFGGPAGQIAMMHKTLVDGLGWVEEKLFLRALNFCMLLPGPEAHQLAIYLGWRLHGTRGGLAAGVFFVLPSVFLMLLLSWLAAAKGHVPAVAAIFHGIAAAVVAIVAEALIRLSRKSLRHPVLYGFAAGSFVLGQFLGVSFPVIVLLAGLGGLALGRLRPDIFCARVPGARECAPDDLPAQGKAAKLPPASRLARVCGLFLILWLAVVGPLLAWRGPSDTLSEIALFFSKAPFVTFGGAYAVLAYIMDHALALDWLSQKDMLTGLGLAETTPGPLIMVTQFVGFLAAWNRPGDLDPMTAGTIGAVVTTFATFLPSFLFIFAGAPYIEAITSDRRLAAALTGISGAVVGVVLKLGVFFAVHTFFPGGGVDPFALAVAAAAFAALIRFQVSMHALVGASALAGLAWKMIH